METAIFAAGCFWGVEEAFRSVRGVENVTVGYCGGHTSSPTYKQVCSGETGHAEVARVEFDPSVVSYGELLEVFWKIHDPTQLNRQGPDFGTQYRSAVFYTEPEQRDIAEESKRQLQASGKFARPVVTEITPASTFWPAEDYHQQYLSKRGVSGCHL
ncbi:MAG: peptide-methionine (S)-S-oxide reductase MsrA [Armatimonadetes bacterium]|nr:peptide-methionine (S)-S-oxide reductase MsrA [Armatimonadota bacterium]